MNKSHSKYRWKNPKQDLCKPNSVIFLKGNSTPEQTAFKSSTELNIQNAINVIQTSTESRREITWLLIKRKQLNWRRGDWRGCWKEREINKKRWSVGYGEMAPIPITGLTHNQRRDLDEHFTAGSGPQVPFPGFWQRSTFQAVWWFHGWLPCDQIIDAYVSALSTVRRLNDLKKENC